ncbi:MAG: RIP metalloprotease RseP [Patescibacteria group bacterium]
MFITIVLFIVVLSVMVFFHELGHYGSARYFRVKTDEFGFGLPPRLCGWKKVNGKRKFFWGNEDVDKIKSEDTIWSLNWIPLGGFVKIKGENGEDKTASDSFTKKKIWQRMIMISAGVIMNVFLTFICLSVVYMIGAPEPISDAEIGQTQNYQIQVLEVFPNTPADKAGLQMGDALLSLDGQHLQKISQVQEFITQHGQSEINLVVDRFGEQKNFNIKPEYLSANDKIALGVSLIASGKVKYPFFTAIWKGFKATGYMFVAILQGFCQIFVRLFQHQPIGVDVAGPIGIAAMTGQVAKLGFVYILNFMALLSMNLAIINFLPLPALDGGRFLFLIVEKLRGKSANEKVEQIVHTAGFFLLMGLFVFVTGKDLFKYKDSLINIWNNFIH